MMRMRRNYRSDPAVIAHIKSSVTVPQALCFYGCHADGKRIPCPIHHGKNNNFSYNDRAFRCFSCGASGSVIDLVMQLFDMSFSDAVRKMDADFNLGLTGAKPDAAAGYSAKYAQRTRELKLAARAAELRKMLSEHRRLHAAYTRGDPDDPEYIEACKKLEVLSYLIDNFETEDART